MTPHRRRAARLLATSAVVALAVTACSQGSASNDDPTDAEGSGDGQTTLTYMNFSSNGGNEENLALVVDAFEADNPGITVEVETFPYDDYFTVLQTAVAGGTEADVFELNYENFVTYALNGSLAPLEGVDEAAYKPSLLEAFQLDGTQYGLPESFSNVVLFYNADLFEAAGVEPPTADWTWADERAAAEALTDTATGTWGDYQPISFHEFYKVLAQNGGEFLSEDRTEATFASPEGIEAAEWLVEKSGTVMPTTADGAGTPDFDTNLFTSGQLAMWHTGIWMFGPLADVDFAWDIAVEPGNTENASAMFSNTAVVSARSANTDAAQAWAEYLTSSEAMVQMRLDTGWELPPVADESLLAPYLEQTPPTNRQAVFDSLDAIVLPPAIESQTEMQDIVTEELTEAAAGRKSVEEALTSAQERVTALL
ncbi:sugar ABC transporter substrate-binding protein [Occultella glacieicola]|uniref:Sugar ABC transporter substrate-binding protein n=1 Tax=Occultella glacieicola TaxID=2518684 RepID=A0ABY2E2S9_9MICO|nr:sugar ABC transporter substrate-binding protein [Occultella glacieicola]TDE90061.1 sugar ABC transporter substrate-binding protein [Occultella glacieicola]